MHTCMHALSVFQFDVVTVSLRSHGNPWEDPTCKNKRHVGVKMRSGALRFLASEQYCFKVVQKQPAHHRVLPVLAAFRCNIC